MAETDKTGNVNVSRFKDRFAGAGGFINISQNARKVIFVGTFTAGGLKIALDDGRMVIEQEGRNRKLIDEVEQITFNGAYSASKGKEVLYITERCVFRLTTEGLELTEIAPGIDLQKDILDQMDFAPTMNDVTEMDPRIFLDQPMRLRRQFLDMPISDRMVYDASKNIVYGNLSGLIIENDGELDHYDKELNEFFSKIGKKVNLISNYDGISVSPRMVAKFTNLLCQLEDDYYLTATRYTTSAFLRQKLGQDLKTRAKSPHIFETRREAAKYIESVEGSA